METIAPNQTIYIRNLNEKVKKETLVKQLYSVFGTYGQILDVVALKTDRMRGQAFVVFKDAEASSNAMRSLQGFPFYDKPMQIAYAKSKSDVVAKADGTFVEREKRKRGIDDATMGVRHKQQQQPRGPAAAPLSQQQQQQQLQQQPAGAAAAAGAYAQQPYGVPGGGAVPMDTDVPNATLFVSNLPAESNEEMVTALFNQFPGMKEVRLPPGKTDIAFVEFEDEFKAAGAKTALQNFKFSETHTIHIVFAKK